MSDIDKRLLAASSIASVLLCSLGGPAHSQTPAPSASTPTALPDVDVTAPKHVQAQHKPRTRVATTTGGKRRVTPTRSTAPQRPQQPQQTPEQVVAGKNDQLDQVRRNLYAPTGAGSYEMSQERL